MATYPYSVTNLPQDPMKPKKPLPTWDNQVQSVPLQTPPQNANPLDTANDQVMGAAQNKAITGAPNELMKNIVAQTNNLVKDPNMGRNYEAEKQLALEKQNRNMNQQLETLRQQTATTAYTGQNLRDLTNVAMQAVQQRADTSRQWDMDQAKAEREAMIQALTAGQNVAQQERGAFSQDIQDLLNVRGAYEGEKNRAQESNMLDKTFLQDIEKLKLANNFDAAKQAIDVQLQKELAAGNWQNAITLTDMKGTIEKDIQKYALDFQKSERVATQGWQTSERLGSEDAAKAIELLRAETQKALQTGDFEKAKYLQEQDGLLQLKMQTNEMNNIEKMAYLDNQLANAKAENDVDRQIQLWTFQHGQEMETLTRTMGHENAMMYANQAFERAMQSNDFIQARAIQANQLNAAAEENQKDRVLEQAKIALAEKGQDFAQTEKEYNMILDEIELGLASPDAAIKYLNQQLTGSGIQLTPLDASVEAKAALKEDYDQQEYQFALTHQNDGNFVYIDETNTLKLTPNGQKEFLNYINELLYNQKNSGKTAQGANNSADKPEAAKINTNITSPTPINVKLSGPTAPTGDIVGKTTPPKLPRVGTDSPTTVSKPPNSDFWKTLLAPIKSIF